MATKYLSLKPVSFLTANQYSPWPKRILGVEKWSKPSRDKADILAEYNDFWYKDILNLWQQEFETKPIVRPLSFFSRLEKFIFDRFLSERATYGSDNTLQLASVGEDYYLLDWNTLRTLHIQLVQQILKTYVDQLKVTTVVELGSGMGINLFHLNEYCHLDFFLGGDICPNAVTLCNKISKKCNTNSTFIPFDYYEPDCMRAIEDHLSKETPYLIYTSHSIEQISMEKSDLVNKILSMKHKPEAVLHIEPVLNPESDDLKNHLNRSYSVLNKYNQDLLEDIIKHEKEGHLKILEKTDPIYGMSPFNPSCVLAWEPY